MRLFNDRDYISRASALSPFFLRTVEADPSQLPLLQERLAESYSEAEMRAFLAQADIADEAGLKRSLRQLRRRVMLRVIARDLNGLADLYEVMATMTVLAEVAVQEALAHLERWQQAIHGIPRNDQGEAQQLIVVGMGKLGGGELNVSSDIDLIFAYGEDGETDGGRRTSNHEFFANLGKKLIAAIGEATADGFVFRVDMRLRPYGDSGALVGSYDMLEQYYQTQGREWERYAWIKGRVIAGPADELQSLLRPFVFRKYLDYGAFASMRDLKAQIQREVHRREMHDNIKLGPGGIREIEFIAQVFQLIRGGRDTALQIRPTLQVLRLVAERGQLEQQAVEELHEAYVFLRDLEHRLQYLQDAQTQMLPTDDENRARIAQAMGCADWDQFLGRLQPLRSNVERHFSEVFSIQSAGLPQANGLGELWNGSLDDAEGEQRLADLGYLRAQDSWRRLHSLRSGSRYRQLPAASRERFDALLPTVLELATGCANPDETLARMTNLLESICRRASYLALLAEYPHSLELVVKLVSASPWLSDYLAQHPILLDELLDTRGLFAVPDFAVLRDELMRQMAEAAGDVELQMDVVRHFKHAQVFRFAAQDLTGNLALETLSDYLSALADLILQVVLEAAWPMVRGRHRETPHFAVIGYGKLGGKELGYASDLDIIFIYDDEASDAGEVYARFGQRINNWLSSMTPAGLLYETDLRLRPDGASGLLVTSLQAFEEYQSQKAWTWEHQALTRARFCAGDAAIGTAFESIRNQVLRQPRDIDALRTEVVAMRQKMHDGHPNDSGLFDIKHDHGGIVDVEFIVQYLVLAHAHEHESLTRNYGNIALLHMAAALGLVDAELSDRAAQAYRMFRRAQHSQRLQGATARVPTDKFQDEIAAVQQLWRAMLSS